MNLRFALLCSCLILTIGVQALWVWGDLDRGVPRGVGVVDLREGSPAPSSPGASPAPRKLARNAVTPAHVGGRITAPIPARIDYSSLRDLYLPAPLSLRLSLQEVLKERRDVNRQWMIETAIVGGDHVTAWSLATSDDPEILARANEVLFGIPDARWTFRPVPDDATGRGRRR